GHFASAYVTLMRAAGLPARVVTGYLGGTWNPVGEYFAVRQADAHAWAEVWLEDQGWVRFDPTAMVAPERMQRGLLEFLPGARSAAGALVQDTDWLRTLRDTWDAAGSWWQLRVVQFNAARQRNLLGWLGLGNIDYRGMAALLLGGAATWGAFLLLLAARRPRSRQDAVAKLWRWYERLLAGHGLHTSHHQGPESIRREAAKTWPAAAPAIDRFTHTYVTLRFGRTSPPGGIAALRAALRDVTRALRRAPRATTVSPARTSQ